MNLLLKNVVVNDPAAAAHGRKVDVSIENGRIKAMEAGAVPGSAAIVIEMDGAFISPGWMDMRANLGEPGFEQKENIHSGQNAAAHGGFTDILMMPTTDPLVEHGSEVAFILNKSKGQLTTVHPAGVLSEGAKGKELAGLYDMKRAGAVAFTDDKKAVGDSGLMLRALMYAADIDAPVISFADDQGLTRGLQVTESPFTTGLGFKGMPPFAESIAIERDLSLVRYTGKSLHLSGVSTAGAVGKIRQAKKEGLAVTAEVYVYHLLLDDTSLEGFSSHMKVKPPLRTREDVLALQEAVLDGTIDVVCSDHSPHEKEVKDIEFDYAAFGMIGFESFYGVLRESLGFRLSPELLYRLLVQSPREILGLPVPRLATGENACFTCYHPDYEWQFDQDRIHSRSQNTPFLSHNFRGMVLCTGNNGQFISNLNR